MLCGRGLILESILIRATVVTILILRNIGEGSTTILVSTQIVKFVSPDTDPVIPSSESYHIPVALVDLYYLCAGILPATSGGRTVNDDSRRLCSGHRSSRGVLHCVSYCG